MLCAPAYAEDLDACGIIRGFAETSMEARQNGAPVDQMVLNSRAIAQNFPTLSKLVEAHLLEAYEMPRYSSEEYRRRAVTDFANAKYVECRRATDP